jgi:hypothetical protein
MQIVEAVVGKAAQEAGLPEQVSSGFDGAAFVWIWRDEVDAEGEKALIEASARARPDPKYAEIEMSGTGAEIEVSGRTWLVEKSHIAWARTYWQRYLTQTQLELDSKNGTIMGEVAGALASAWKGASDHAKHLMGLDARRREVLQEVVTKFGATVTDDLNRPAGPSEQTRT